MHRSLVLLAVCLFALVLCSPSNLLAQTYTESVLYNFPYSDFGDGQNNLAMDSAGNLYGTETYGGNPQDCDMGPCGSIFKISAGGVFSTLYEFTGRSREFGPLYLVIDKSGNLYGTTYGMTETLFEFDTKTNTFSVLSTFDDSPTEVLTVDQEGNLLGTTLYGGPDYNSTIFKVTPDGVKTVLFNFTNGGPLNGYYPSNVVLGNSQGELYGVIINLNGGPGYLYEVTSSGEMVLNDSLPSSPGYLSRSAAGNFYGGTGTELWEVLGSDYAFSEYTFTSLSDLYGPLALLDGNIYGTALFGGTYQGGGVYEYNESTGTETTLYNFCSLPNCVDGETPEWGVITDSKGNLYGTTAAGGKYNGGVVFKLTKN